MTTRELQAPANGRATEILAAALAITFTAADVPLDRVLDNPDNHRRDDPAAAQADDELVNSIGADGVLQPILVWQDGEGHFHLVAGHRRVRCARRAGLTTIPARVLSRQPTAGELLRLALVENLQRLDVSPIEFGLACLDLMATGRTASDVAGMLHKKSVSTITRAVALIRKIPADLHESIRRKELPPSVARELTVLTDDDAKRAIARRYLSKELKTRAEVTAAVRAARNGSAAAREPAGFICEVAGVRVRVELAAGQGLREAETVLRELARDLQAHRGQSVGSFCDFLTAKALARRKAAEHQAAETALAERLKPDPTPP